jgi:membrane-associated phospholipid phosphatase
MPLRFYLRFEKPLLITAVALFFLAGYLGIAIQTSHLNARVLETAIDRAIPFVPAAWPIYQSVYLLVLLPTRLFSRPVEMRSGAAANVACMATAYACFLLIPVRMIPPADASSALAAGFPVHAQQFALFLDDHGMNCFPSLHLALATIASLCCARADRRLGALAWTLTALIAISSLLLKRHYLVDLPAGVALGGRLCAPELRS